MHRSRTTIAIAALAGLLALSACGSSDSGVSVQQSETGAPAGSGPAGGSDETTSAEPTDDTAPENTSTDDTSADDTDDTDLSIPDFSLPDISIPDFSIPDISIPDISIDFSDLTVPPGLSDECAKLYTEFTGAFATIMAGGDDAEQAADDLADNLADALPPELHDDAEVVANAFHDIATVMAKYHGDMSQVLQDPDATAAFDELDSPEVTQASDNISAYLEKTCPGIND